MGLVLVGVTTNTTRTIVSTDTSVIAWASRGLMGVPLSFPAEMENRLLGFAAPFWFPSIQKPDNLKLSKSGLCPQNPERMTYA